MNSVLLQTYKDNWGKYSNVKDRWCFCITDWLLWYCKKLVNSIFQSFG